MPSTPLICCSNGAATVSATTSADAPGYLALTTTVGGAISGYSEIGRVEIGNGPDNRNDQRDNGGENGSVDKKVRKAHLITHGRAYFDSSRARPFTFWPGLMRCRPLMTILSVAFKPVLMTLNPSTIGPKRDDTGGDRAILAGDLDDFSGLVGCNRRVRYQQSFGGLRRTIAYDRINPGVRIPAWIGKDRPRPNCSRLGVNGIIDKIHISLHVCKSVSSAISERRQGSASTREEVLFPALSRRMYFKKSASLPMIIKLNWIERDHRRQERRIRRPAGNQVSDVDASVGRATRDRRSHLAPFQIEIARSSNPGFRGFEQCLFFT